MLSGRARKNPRRASRGVFQEPETRARAHTRSSRRFSQVRSMLSRAAQAPRRPGRCRGTFQELETHAQHCPPTTTSWASAYYPSNRTSRREGLADVGHPPGWLGLGLGLALLDEGSPIGDEARGTSGRPGTNALVLMSDGVPLLLGELGRYPVEAPNCLMRVVNWFLPVGRVRPDPLVAGCGCRPTCRTNLLKAKSPIFNTGQGLRTMLRRLEPLPTTLGGEGCTEEDRCDGWGSEGPRVSSRPRLRAPCGPRTRPH